MGRRTPTGRRASLWHVLRTVLSASIGVRRRGDHEQDMVEFRPAQVIVAALLGAALFVLALVLIVRVVTRWQTM